LRERTRARARAKVNLRSDLTNHQMPSPTSPNLYPLLSYQTPTLRNARCMWMRGECGGDAGSRRARVKLSIRRRFLALGSLHFPLVVSFSTISPGRKGFLSIFCLEGSLRAAARSFRGFIARLTQRTPLPLACVFFFLGLHSTRSHGAS
jgi:hypothetical protein